MGDEQNELEEEFPVVDTTQEAIDSEHLADKPEDLSEFADEEDSPELPEDDDD